MSKYFIYMLDDYEVYDDEDYDDGGEVEIYE